MKKIIFSLALLTGINVNAQLPDGSVAPDFTLTDINGVSHNLYTYLDQGKTVFLDISATWCGPCWGFHESGALDDLWAAHGPAGGNGVNANTTDDVIVIYIEGDDATNSADLNGTGTNTQGDWVTGVDHPIIDPPAAQINAFNSDYAIGYFPTIYKICPNRIISEPGQATADDLYASVADCPDPASTATDVRALANKGNLNICGPASYTPKVQIQNNGLTDLTNATVSVTYNGVEVSTGTYTGALTTYDVATITCSVIPNFSGGNLSITVTSTNDSDLTNDNLTVNVIGAIETNNVILLTALTDAYATETSWKIKTATGATVAGTTDPTLANNTTYNFTYTLANLGCFTYSITDSYGDGISAPGTINVRDSYGNVILNDEDFGTGINIPFKVVHIVGQAPTISSNGTVNGQTITACGSAILTSSATQGNLWSNGATTRTITVTTPGTYSVVVDGITSSVMDVIIMAAPTVNAGLDVSVCQGAMVTLNGAGADSFTWDNGVTNGTAFAVTATTNYTVTGTAANGCTDTDIVTVTKLTLPIVNAGADLDVCNGAMVTLNGAGASTYVWSNGVTNGTAFAATGIQVYTVTGTAANGCTNTDVVTVATHDCSAGIDENTSNLINVYPNPSNGNVTIKSDELTQFKTVELIDQLGRTLSTWKISSSIMNIELKDIANGNYTLVFKGDNAISTQKIQVNK